MKYFVFALLPEDKIFNEYQLLINKYSRELNTPSFEPHITIYKRIVGKEKPIIQRVQEAVENTEKLQIELTEVSISTTYYQCIFARVKVTPELLNLHTNIGRQLGKKEAYMYMPHMSLVHGNLKSDKKFELAENIKLGTTRFVADKVVIVSADKNDPKTWGHVAEFFLSNKLP